MVSDLEKRECEVFLKSRDMLKVMEGLRQDKVALKVRLLGPALGAEESVG